MNIIRMRHRRALLGWWQGTLAEASSISKPTTKRLEAAEGDLGGRPDTIEKITNALESAGVEFIAEKGGGDDVRLKGRRD